MIQTIQAKINCLPVLSNLLGESPVWHPKQKVLYWCDISGKSLHRFNPKNKEYKQWKMPSEPSCCALYQNNNILIATRQGLIRLDTQNDALIEIEKPPYLNSSIERFNDGKTDAKGRFWIGTIYEPRDAQNAALYYFDNHQFIRVAGEITNSNGLAFSPCNQTLYWADTKAHIIRAFDFDLNTGLLNNPSVFHQFQFKNENLKDYEGRPDGAAVDCEGFYWVAMFEGAQILRLSPKGEIVARLRLPVQCPTMVCFGGDDLKTLFITTSRENRPLNELKNQPLAGKLLSVRVSVAGLPAFFVNNQAEYKN